MSLVEYAKQARVKKCATCELAPSLLQEVNEGRRNGVSVAIISKWLADEKKVNLTPQKLRAHFAHAGIKPVETANQTNGTTASVKPQRRTTQRTTKRTR